AFSQALTGMKLGRAFLYALPSLREGREIRRRAEASQPTPRAEAGQRDGFMIVSSFGRYLSQRAHDHEMPPRVGWVVVAGGIPGAGVNRRRTIRTISRAVRSGRVGEVGRALAELGGDRLDLVRAANQRADLLLLGGKARGQVHPAGQVEQPLGGPD